MADQRGLVKVGWDMYRLDNDEGIPERVIELAVFGIALHERVYEPLPETDIRGIHYRHAGLVRDLEAGIAWLRREDVEIIEVYPISTNGESAAYEKEKAK